MKHHLIFEGAELAGKSWVMSQIYNYLQTKYKKSKYILDGCHWFNADNGIFGTKNSQKVVDGYLNIFQALKNENVIVEKFFIADQIYHYLYHQKNLDYTEVEKKLLDLNFKIILITFPEDKKVLEKRIQDRLNIYPHYKNILHDIDWYINQQKEYQARLEKSKIPYFIVKTNILPDEKLIFDILSWIKEK